MRSITKPATVLGIAATITLMATAPSGAQSMSNAPADTWSYTVNPGPNGQCWIPTDRSNSERGFGYWGACSASATPIANEARGARAEATKSHSKKRVR